MSNVERVQDARAAEPEVLYAVDGNIATITLNRPERLNTISRPMLAQLGQLLLQADNDPDVRAVILTATGRAFCAGLDVGSASSGTGIGSQSDADGARTTLDLKTAPPTILFNMEKPTICALNGAAAGYGMDTALGCDIRIMAESAKFAAAFVKRGIVPESGGTWFLPRMLGWAKAAEIIFTGRTLSAKESLETLLTIKCSLFVRVEHRIGLQRGHERDSFHGRRSAGSRRRCPHRIRRACAAAAADHRHRHRALRPQGC
ncbi:MAG: Enoyl-CoA hydratase [Afipia sp.]|jgi:enoyl-CoA hydratase/carnithine racemase|nr:MAG: Enoyl-CoA hydratase [Afipia sp.]